MKYPQDEGFDFGRFFREQQPALERFITARIGATGDAEEIAAEVMVQLVAYCRVHPERRITNHRAVLFTIARRRIADHFDRRSKMREISIEEASEIPAPYSIPAAIDADAELRAVQSALVTIREEYREVITLYAIVGLSVREIAEMMEKPAPQVSVLLFRARRSLRKALRRQRQNYGGASEMDKPSD